MKKHTNANVTTKLTDKQNLGKIVTLTATK